jgi:hypothetical protein
MTHDPDDWNPMLPSLDVPEHKPKKTGLVDVRGKPIKRYPRPIGFHIPRPPRG